MRVLKFLNYSVLLVAIFCAQSFGASPLNDSEVKAFRKAIAEGQPGKTLRAC